LAFREPPFWLVGSFGAFSSAAILAFGFVRHVFIGRHIGIWVRFEKKPAGHKSERRCSRPRAAWVRFEKKSLLVTNPGGGAPGLGLLRFVRFAKFRARPFYPPVSALSRRQGRAVQAHRVRGPTHIQRISHGKRTCGPPFHFSQTADRQIWVTRNDREKRNAPMERIGMNERAIAGSCPIPFPALLSPCACRLFPLRMFEPTPTNRPLIRLGSAVRSALSSINSRRSSRRIKAASRSSPGGCAVRRFRWRRYSETPPPGHPAWWSETAITLAFAPSPLSLSPKRGRGRQLDAFAQPGPDAAGSLVFPLAPRGEGGQRPGEGAGEKVAEGRVRRPGRWCSARSLDIPPGAQEPDHDVVEGAAVLNRGRETRAERFGS
jgi:hypothetical protein